MNVRNKITLVLDFSFIGNYICNGGKDMLLKFTVDNYRGFKTPVTIDFTKTHDYKFNQQCIKNGLLNTIIIYGRNGSGKSNLGFALFDIVGLLTDKTIAHQQLDDGCFVNADSGRREVSFEYVFSNGNRIIRYIYRKTSPKKLSYEELSVNKTKIYSFDYINRKAELLHLDKIDAPNLNLDYFEGNFPLLRHIANNTMQKEDSVVKFLMNYVSHMLWFRSLQENGDIGLKTGSDNLDTWIIDNNLLKEFDEFLRNIAGIETNLSYATVKVNQVPVKLLIDKHKNNSLLFDNIKSSGTSALELLFYWSKSFNDVSFLFMDEFDAFYHYDLAKEVVKYVSSFTNMQTIFTTHNPYLASNDLLRPDCYFTLSKGELKSFADRTDRELREGHNLEKMLKNGEFDD